MGTEEPPRVQTHQLTKNLHTEILKITVQGACTFKYHYKELATKKPVKGMDIRCNLQGRQVSLGKINQWRALVNMVMNLRVPYNAGKFLSRCTIGSFSRKAQLPE
jgi:hypothetical protein